jgi:hypothetical protein
VKKIAGIARSVRQRVNRKNLIGRPIEQSARESGCWPKTESV